MSKVPPKPKRMSEKKYRELYDSTPQALELSDGGRLWACGEISAEVLAKTYRRKGIKVTIRRAK